MRKRSRGGFTMIELLISITIVVILAGLTIAVITTTMNSDRIRSSARTIQAAIAGGRDRALRAQRFAPTVAGKKVTTLRGVRFNLDSPVMRPASGPVPASQTVSSLLYVGSDGPYFDGDVQLYFDDSLPTPKVVYLYGRNANWKKLESAKVLRFGSPIVLQGTRYQLTSADGLPTGVMVEDSTAVGFSASALTDGFTERIKLGAEYLQPAALPIGSGNPAFSPWAYSPDPASAPYGIELEPFALPGELPVVLSSGITIDLLNSRNVPADVGTLGYFDVLFSSRGTVTGKLGSAGLLHLYVTETKNVIMNIEPSDPPVNGAGAVDFTNGVRKGIGDALICTLRTQTGNLGTFRVNPVDSDSDGVADDPFRFAKEGKDAGR